MLYNGILIAHIRLLKSEVTIITTYKRSENFSLNYYSYRYR